MIKNNLNKKTMTLNRRVGEVNWCLCNGNLGKRGSSTLFTFLHSGTGVSRADSLKVGGAKEGPIRSPRLGIESPCDPCHVQDS